MEITLLHRRPAFITNFTFFENKILKSSKSSRSPPSRATEAPGGAARESKDWAGQSNPIQKQYQPMQIHA